MGKAYLHLQHSESVVIQAATQIYSAYVISGRANEDNETKMLEHSLRQAIQLARAADDAIVSEGEME